MICNGKSIRKAWLCGMVFALVFCCAIAVAVNGGAVAARAEQVSMEGSGDTFVNTETAYGAQEAFAYVSVVEFERGNAAGLSFGGQEDGSCFVFNVDRADNRVKLMYFYGTADDRKVKVLKEEYYVGSALMNAGERDYVRSRTANIDKVYLKVAVNADGTAEFYADGIRRFAYKDGSEAAETINLNGFTLGDEENTPIEYKGGFLGYNCFNAKVNFTDTLIGETDYGYYGEFYRNQYHFSQFAHWNNDPNGLVYYKGYYHLYFQHNPYGNTWDAMHWGHARSKDLVHWELLPIALVPDYDLPEGENKLLGAMWSGSARVYHKGDSDKIDNEYKWFGDAADKQDGDPLGLIGFYTWFGDGGNRYQVVMYSTDGGLSWNKRNNIPCNVSLNLDGSRVNGGSWRDPKVLDISALSGIADGYKWGMALTDMEDNTLFFLKSKNLVDWEHAGSYEVYRPECPDVFTLSVGSEKHTVITFTSRYYVVCDLIYKSGNIVMTEPSNRETEITKLDKDSTYLQVMDYGVDSYAGQTFYIDDASSAYNGKSVGISWFSGVPNAAASIESGVLASARKVWNGGGMTVPVEYGLIEKGGGFTLTTTPITVNDAHFSKTPLEGLEEISDHCFEIDATVPNESGNPVYFRINMSEDGKHYTEIGWNEQDGYYVDRTHTEDAGINFPQPNYACKYASGMGRNNTTLDFYILSDNGGVEVYCGGFTVPFYILTFASPYSFKATLTADSAESATVTVNRIASVWRSEESEETLINLSATQIDMGVRLGNTQTITAYAQGKEISYKVTEGEDVIEVTPTDTGARITALKAGEAKIEVTAGASGRTVDVTVHDGSAESDFTFESDGIVSGNWYFDGNALIGEQSGGDGFILANEGGGDFTYSASFDLGSGAAAALVFRAAAENGKLTSYLIANYDNNSKIVKLWSQNGELGNVAAGNPDIKNLVLTAEAKGRNVKVYLNGNKLIDCDIRESDPLSGKFGLNVCATKAAFSSVTVQKSEYGYSGDGDMVIKSSVEQQALEIVNVTLGNAALSSEQFVSSGRDITIKQSYLELLPQAGDYTFVIYGSAFAFTVKVNVPSIPRTELDAVTVDAGISATVWLGNSKVDYVKVNGEEIDPSLYKISGYTLALKPEALEEGENTVQINDSQSVTVTVLEVYRQPVATPSDTDGGNTDTGLIVGLSVGIVLAAGAAVAVTVILLLRRKSVRLKESKKEES